ncbi:MAG: hypothetical protein NVSMB49_14740 [Ktedonobacteraceae bacterium]
MHKGPSSQQLPRELRGIHGLSPLLALLGMPDEVYVPAKIPFLARVLGFFCILVGVLITSSFLLFSQILSSSWLWWQVDFIPLIGAIWIVTGLWFILVPLVSHRVRVAVCPKGLLYVKRGAKAIPWDTISRFWKDIHIDRKGNIFYSCKVQCRDDSTFLFTQDIDSVERLGRLIEREVAQRLLPEAIATYDTGMFVAFEEIAIDIQGIHVKHKDAPLLWDDVEHVGINQMVISMYKKGEYWDWATLPIARIPNVVVLKQLISYVRQEHGKGPLRRMIVAYNAGFSLHFGSITLSLQGIDLGKKTLSWSEIGSIDIGEQEIMIKRPSSIWGQDEWEVFPMRTIPNAPLLKELVEYVLQGKRH